ncbi:hypothetical protein [Arthrobacter sp. UYCu712]|uniref:hypothetical protein n=1 Tax=Arthrobacter sp. UYCu712 TaxID=3156340 RepID=UPI003391755B
MPNGDLHIAVGGLDFYGRPGLGPFAITSKGIDGWDDGVTMRGQKAARPGAAGSYRLKRYQESRTVTLDGIILAGSAEEQEALGLQISGLLAHGDEGRIQIEKNGLIQWALATIDVSNVNPHAAGFYSDFQIVFWCADHRKFGELRTVPLAPGTPAKLINRGNFKASPVVEIDGPLAAGFSITHPGGQYIATGAIGAGDKIRVDFHTARLRLNGDDRSDLILQAQTCTVPAGPITQFSISGGAGRVEVQDTYT